jgi:hypothetical protein
MRNIFLTFAFLALVVFARCQKKTVIEPDERMIVKNYEGHIHIGFLSSGKNMQISFYPCGVNQLFALAKVSYFSSMTAYNQEQASSAFSSSTDWVGPYYVCSTSSANSGLTQKFTGGWHGSNGDGTGMPTASTSEVITLVDLGKADGNFERNCEQVDLYATNLVHGYDYSLTNKNLLKETVHYSIKPNRQIDVQVRIEALENIVIQRYYGLQSQNFALFDQVSYIADQQVINTAGINIDSRCSTNEAINTILLNSNKNQHQLRLVLNATEGLGVSGNLGSGVPKAFSASYRKSYFNLINGKDLPMKKGEEVYWKGSYFWD